MAQAIERSDWERYCERISEALGASDAEIEVASLKLGRQVETRWLPLIGITYDPNDDIIDVALEGVDHIIEHPQELSVDGDAGGITALEIKDNDGNQHLVRLKDALALPAPR